MAQQSLSLVYNYSVETNWCEHVANVIENSDDSNDFPKDVAVSWAAYNSRNVDLNQNNVPETISAMLPLFREDSKSVAMMRHTVDVVRRCVETVNPGQIPVIEANQPLFKLLKEVQWTWLETHGENSVVILLGGLHIKMTLLKAMGALLDGSGWVSALISANVATSGTADSFLKVSHVKKTLRAYQITACALFSLRKEAFQEH